MVILRFIKKKYYVLKREEAELFLKPTQLVQQHSKRRSNRLADRKRVQLLPEYTEARTAQELNGNDAVLLQLLNLIRTSLNKL